MKGIIKIEEASMLVLAIIAFSQMELSWWWFVGLFLTPDIGMFGYVFNSKVGAWSYNFFHLRGLAILLYLVRIMDGSMVCCFRGDCFVWSYRV